MGRDLVQGYFNHPPAWHRRLYANMSLFSKDAEDTTESQCPEFSCFLNQCYFYFARLTITPQMALK